VRRPVRILAASLALTALAALGIASCKQGEGERCQVDDDCAAGLTCNQGEGVCRSVSSDNQPIDAQPPKLLDAAIDAPPDAPIDAM
jgi:hypothetical protein